ncbi:hypothetical protein Tco_0524219 [Tanacetum coccineum]
MSISCPHLLDVHLISSVISSITQASVDRILLSGSSRSSSYDLLRITSLGTHSGDCASGRDAQSSAPMAYHSDQFSGQKSGLRRMRSSGCKVAQRELMIIGPLDDPMSDKPSIMDCDTCCVKIAMDLGWEWLQAWALREHKEEVLLSFTSVYALSIVLSLVLLALYEGFLSKKVSNRTESSIVVAAREPRGQYDFVDAVEAGQGLIRSPGHDARTIA